MQPSSADYVLSAHTLTPPEEKKHRSISTSFCLLFCGIPFGMYYCKRVVGAAPLLYEFGPVNWDRASL